MSSGPAGSFQSDTSSPPPETDSIAGRYAVWDHQPIVRDGERLGKVDSASIELREDKTFSFSAHFTFDGRPAEQLKVLNRSILRTDDFEGFWSVDGRKLTLEAPNRWMTPMVIMLDSNRRSFTYDWSLPDSMLSLNLRFFKGG